MRTFGFDTILTENTLKIPEKFFIPGNVKIVLIYDDEKKIVDETEAFGAYDKIMKDYKPAYEELAK
jgi:hypothetical protein